MKKYIPGIYLLLLLLNLITISIQQGCVEGQFECSGEGRCIQQEDVCDGEPDCLDGSDETSNLCLHSPCNRPLEHLGEVGDLFGLIAANHFRCNYGACIPHQFKCDGIRNCLDNSDENTETCASQRCDRQKFRCDYGACIPRSQKCNGKIDCNDQSDETENLCKGRTCRRNYFQCKYGACIYHRRKCNGRFDCADKSDESPELCGYESPLSTTTSTTSTTTTTTSIPTTTTTSTTSTPATTTTTTTSTPTTTTTTTIPTTTASTTTETTTTTTATTATTLTTSEKTTSATSTTTIPPTPFQHIFTKHTTPTTSSSLSSSEGRCKFSECLCPPPLQICVPCYPGLDVIQICQSIVEERNLCSLEAAKDVQIDIITCGSMFPFMNVDEDSLRINDNQCGSTEGVPSNTLAFIDCWGKTSELVECQPDGRWFPHGNTNSEAAMDTLCQPTIINSNVCGKLPSPIRGDENKFVWPFLLDVLQDGEFFCSGTLVASQWVLTSTTCFVSEDGYVLNSSSVVASTISVQLSSTLHTKGQELNVTQIYFHPDYNTSKILSNGHLVLLKLETPFTLTEKVVPACLMIQNELNISDEIAITFVREDGRIPRWNIVTQILDTSCTDPQYNCSVHIEDENYFCGKTLNQNVLFDGHLGSPYLVNKGKDNREEWTVAGILSHTAGTHHCPPTPVFMSISKHFQWIKHCTSTNKCSIIH